MRSSATSGWLRQGSQARKWLAPINFVPSQIVDELPRKYGLRKLCSAH
jgi:hypothetical protein